MRPRHAGGHEFFEEQRRGDGAGKAAIGAVDHVGQAGFQHVVIRRPQRQAPHRIAHLCTGGNQLAGQCVIIGKQGGQLRAKCHPCGTGERREIDDQHRVPLAGQRDGIAQHQPAFGIGVGDLHRLAGAGADDVAGAHGIAGNGILRRRDDQVQPDAQIGLNHQLGQRQRMRCAAHIFLHQRHAAARLDVQPAAIEGDALADDGDNRMRGIAPRGFDQARCLGGGAANGVDGGEILIDQRFAGGHPHLGLAAQRVDHCLGQFGRAQIAGRRVDQIAHQRHGFGLTGRRRNRAQAGGGQHARTLGFQAAVTAKAMLGEAPTQPCLAKFTGECKTSGRQFLCGGCQRPWP